MSEVIDRLERKKRNLRKFITILVRCDEQDLQELAEEIPFIQIVGPALRTKSERLEQVRANLRQVTRKFEQEAEKLRGAER